MGFRSVVRSPVLQVSAYGLVSWLAYLHLATSYPLPALVAKYPLTDFGRANGWSQSTLLDFSLTLAAAFICYILAWRALARSAGTRHARRLFALVLAFSLVFAVTLLVMYPITATDVFEYVFHSRILTYYGQNPLATAPIAFKGDPLLKTVNWAVQPSPYGPLWVILTVPGSLLAGSDLLLNLFFMDGLAVVFFLGSILTVAAILRQIDPNLKAAGTLLLAWNPLVLFEAPGNKHNGIIMMFFALFAIYLIARRQWIWALPALVASVLIKYVTALLLPPFLIYCLLKQEGRQERIKYLFVSGALCLLLIAILFLPFLAVPTGLMDEANFYSLLAVPTVAYFWFRGIHGDKMAKTLALGISSGAFMLLYAYGLSLMRRLRSLPFVLILGTWLLLAYLVVGSTYMQPWFAIWPIVLGIWVNHPLTRRVLMAFTFSALLAYVANFFWVWNIRSWQNPAVNLMFVLVIFGPPVLVALVSVVLEWSVHRLRPYFGTKQLEFGGD